MYGLIYFDTEDAISPPEAGVDDVDLWLADMLTERGLTGSFHITGIKARSLEQRGRNDIIQAMARHGVASHFDTGSVQPMTVHQVAKADWEQGVQITLQREVNGFNEIERIFGHCAGLTRHAHSYAPQIIHAVGKLGKVNYGIPFHPPGHRAFWFAGTLCFTIIGLLRNADGRQTDGKFEPAYETDETFEAQLKRYEIALAETARQWDFTAITALHPGKATTSEHESWNHYHGENRTPPLPPPLRTDAQRQTIKRNIARLFDTIAHVPEIKTKSLRELATIYGSCLTQIDQAHLKRYASRVCQTDDVPLDDLFSPAELLVGMAQSVLAYQQSGVMPSAVTAANVIGPTVFRRDQPTDQMTIDDQMLRILCGNLCSWVEDRGTLPDQIQSSNGKIDLVALLGVVAQAYLAYSAGKLPTKWQTTPRAAYPRVADSWRPLIQILDTCNLCSSDFDLTRIIELTCMQAWSVKPAYARIG